MDGENNGKPYEQMDDLGGFPIFLETPIFFENSHPYFWKAKKKSLGLVKQQKPLKPLRGRTSNKNTIYIKHCKGGTLDVIEAKGVV